MSADDPTADALSPMAKKVMYLSHFTPSMMPPETLQAMLVQRGPLLKRTVDSVVHSVETAAKHHHLFVGPRGIGKTHLISLIHHQISQNSSVKSKALIAWMREEEWGVTSFMELVLRILRTLDQTYPELGIDAQTQALYELSIAQAEEQATQILLQAMGDKTLVILLENLDDLFDQLKPTSQKQLRALIQNHPQFVLVATTPSLFTAVTSQNSPFYGFFDIDPLEELSFEDVVELLEKIALERGDTGLATFIQGTEGRARIRAVHHLAEGNPRIYIIFAQFLTQEALDELVQAFMHTLDELTPYYQARMKELSGQQRKIVEYLVHYRGAATVKQIAKACFITQQVGSGQLKQLREKRTVRSIERGRESYYELAEPLMRLCMEVKQQRGEPIGLFVEFLRIWYTQAQLEQKIDLDTKISQVYRAYAKTALELQRAEKIEPSVSAIFLELQKESSAEDKLCLAKEFIVLNTKNSKVKLLQSVIKSLILHKLVEEKTPTSEYRLLALDVLAFMDYMIKNEQNAHELVPILLAASANLYGYVPAVVLKIFRAIWDWVSGDDKNIHILIFKSVSLCRCRDYGWIDEFIKLHPDGVMGKQAGSLIRKMNRLTNAIVDSMNSQDGVSIFRLSREERRFVEEVVANAKKSKI